MNGLTLYYRITWAKHLDSSNQKEGNAKTMPTSTLPVLQDYFKIFYYKLVWPTVNIILICRKSYSYPPHCSVPLRSRPLWILFQRAVHRLTQGDPADCSQQMQKSRIMSRGAPTAKKSRTAIFWIAIYVRILETAEVINQTLTTLA